MKARMIMALFITFSLTGCYYDKEELLYGTSTCNSAGSTYSGVVSPILSQRCNACHSANSASSLGGNVILDNYTSVKSYVTNGKLMGSINHASGFSPMPKSSPKLSSCEIAKITDWVNNGSPNN